ncbi:MAG: hypothetical protein ACXAB4_06920 [Candidatus Hodarchaeales archaeon]|jgi:hypothetical protein
MFSHASQYYICRRYLSIFTAAKEVMKVGDGHLTYEEYRRAKGQFDRKFNSY